MQHAIVIQTQDLEELLDKAITSVLKRHALPASHQPAKKAQGEDSDFLTTNQACKYLHCSKPYLHKLHKEGHITVYPVGQHNLYKRSNLEAYVESNQAKYQANGLG